MERCLWRLGNEKMIRYHNEAWGVMCILFAPVHMPVNIAYCMNKLKLFC